MPRIRAAIKQGTIKKNGSRKSYILTGSTGEYQINHCSDFQDGQAVDYRVDNLKLYVRQEGEKEIKCSVEAKTVPGPPPKTYEKGTILGWGTRVDSNTAGGGGNSSVWTYKRRTKVYELKGSNMIYQIDDCGSFQAGQFSTGQAVQYRIDESNKRDRRIYVLRDNGEEYSCRMEGARGIEPGKADSGAPAQQ